MNTAFRKTLLLVSGVASLLYLVNLTVSRGNYLPYRLLLELGFVWIGTMLGYRLGLGKKTRTVMAALALPLLVIWSGKMLFLTPGTVLFRICISQLLSPVAFTLFGAAHSGIMSKDGDKESALKSALALSLFFPMIVITAYIGSGWTAISFLEWEDMPWDTFTTIRDCSWIISMFLRSAFYVFLVRMFRLDPLQRIAGSKWLKWTVGSLIVLAGVVYFMRGTWYLNSSYLTHRYFSTVLLIPAVWYVLYTLYMLGNRAYLRVRTIREYVKKMDEGKQRNCVKNTQ